MRQLVTPVLPGALAALKTRSGLNQREFAEGLEVSRIYLSEAEAGEGKPTWRSSSV